VISIANLLKIAQITAALCLLALLGILLSFQSVIEKILVAHLLMQIPR
jgi:hypothetical protein